MVLGPSEQLSEKPLRLKTGTVLIKLLTEFVHQCNSLVVVRNMFFSKDTAAEIVISRVDTAAEIVISRVDTAAEIVISTVDTADEIVISTVDTADEIVISTVVN